MRWLARVTFPELHSHRGWHGGSVAGLVFLRHRCGYKVQCFLRSKPATTIVQRILATVFLVRNAIGCCDQFCEIVVQELQFLLPQSLHR